MSYVDGNLLPGETVIARGRVHWWIYVPAVLMLVAGLGLTAVAGPAGGLVVLIGMVMLLRAWLASLSTELAVTNRRVIAKFGFIRRSTVELLHKSVESFHVEQSITGRIFDFGTVIINGTGGVRTPIPDIAAPLEFRRQALNVIDSGGDGR